MALLIPPRVRTTLRNTQRQRAPIVRAMPGNLNPRLTAYGGAPAPQLGGPMGPAAPVTGQPNVPAPFGTSFGPGPRRRGFR
jgi:hypothetical protein